ncbi:MAG: glycosyltransferase [Bacteroides sp.]|nr:glycosyltransferase [Bacteroides sp.]
MKLSIITINFNNEKGLKKTLESVSIQTYKNFEFIIIDGGSTDNSVNIIKEYQPIITYWLSEPDKGIYNAMNKGIAQAHGEYCIFMNSGDTFYDASTIEKSLPYLDGTAIVSGYTYTDKTIFPAPSEISLGMFMKFSLMHQSTFISTTIQKKYGYDERYKIGADRKFLMQVLLYDNVTYKAIDVTVSNFDMTGISMTNKALEQKEREAILRTLIPPRILKDYLNDSKEIDYNLYLQLHQSKYRKLFYSLIMCMLRFIFLFTKSPKWLKGYPFRLK